MKRALRLLLTLALAAGVGLAVRTWVASPVRISGSSMRDTLASGDVVLIVRFGGYARGDIVECTFPGRDGRYVKRLIGLPGETVEARGGQLYIDGRAVSEPYVSSLTEDFAIRLGEDDYLLLGDNRAESYDSRAADMGCVSEEALLGRAVWRIWPLSAFGLIE